MRKTIFLLTVRALMVVLPTVANFNIAPAAMPSAASQASSKGASLLAANGSCSLEQYYTRDVTHLILTQFYYEEG